jgi:hypothetical protein
VLAMLLLLVMVPECWCCPHHADRECCAVLAMLPLLVMVMECWCCLRQDSALNTGLAMLLPVMMVLECW